MIGAEQVTGGSQVGTTPAVDVAIGVAILAALTEAPAPIAFSTLSLAVSRHLGLADPQILDAPQLRRVLHTMVREGAVAWGVDSNSRSMYHIALPPNVEPADAAQAAAAIPPAKKLQDHADLDRMWVGGLLSLSSTLQGEARSVAPRWVWWRLARGARVACRVHPTHQLLQFRISRQEAPAEGRRHRWDLELKTFVRYLGLTGWEREDEETDQGIAAYFLEPAPQPSLGLDGGAR